MRELESIKEIKKAPNKYVNTTGDTMTGNLLIENGNIPSITIKNTNAADTLLTFDRGNNAANWRFRNSSGMLLFETDYISSKVNYYSAARLEFNSGNFTVKGELFAQNGQRVFHANNKPTWDDILNKPSVFNPASHNHDLNYALKTNGFDNELSKVPWRNLDSSSKTAFAYADANATDKPPGQDHALMQMAYSDLWKTQVAHDWRTNKVFIRSKNNGTWLSWSELYSTNNKPNWNDIQSKPTTFAPSSHTHDDRYFTETEINGMMSESATAGKIAKRDSAGDISCRLVRATYDNQSTFTGALAFRTNNSSDNYVRFCSNPEPIRSWLGALALSGGTMTGEINLNNNALKLTTADSGYPRLGYEVATKDVYVSNAGNNWFRLRNDKTITYAGYKVYTSFEKPTPGEIGAATSSHTHDTIVTKSLTDWNTAHTNGYWQSNNGANGPEASGWFWGFRMQHSAGYGAQIAVGNGNGKMYFRSQDANGAGPWYRIYHTGNKPSPSEIGAATASHGHSDLTLNSLVINNPGMGLKLVGDYRTPSMLAFCHGSQPVGRIYMQDAGFANLEGNRWVTIQGYDENNKADTLFGIKADSVNWMFHSCSIRPNSDNSRDLGSTDMRYRKIYSAGGVVTSSDKNMKRNIEYIDTKKRNADKISTNDCYSFIKSIPHATYYYKKKVRPDASTEQCILADKNQTLLPVTKDDFMVGFIAQDIADSKVGKILLNEFKDTGYNYNLNNYVGIISKALQETINKLEALESQLIKK